VRGLGHDRDVVEAVPACAGRAPIVLFLGLGAALASIALYAAAGYGLPMLGLWLIAVALLAAHFAAVSEKPGRLAVHDVIAPPALVLAFAPLYLLRLGSVPTQVNSDEVVIMTVAKTYAGAAHVDPFGVSDYFGSPAALFVLWGRLGHLLGGIDLAHMRLLHASCGLLTIGCSYGFFRQLMAYRWALFASCVLGLNHAFLMISRMAMRENTVVLVEVVALALLLYGLREGNAFATFAGGLVAGLGYYVYFPGRSVFLLWIAYLGFLSWMSRREFSRGRIARLGAISTVGFLLVATPQAVAYVKAPAALTDHQRTALLVFAGGRKLQEHWVSASSVAGGVERNIVLGLTAFNSDHADNAWIYPNRGHGFLDPLSGVLLWLGVGVVAAGLVRRRRSPLALLPVVGFGVSWLAFAFIVGEAPDYPRMLVTLPFVAFLVTESVRAAAGRARVLAGTRGLLGAAAVGSGALVAIAIWNGSIAWDFVRAGRAAGDDIGSTGRYVQALSANWGERFYVAANQTRWSYYVWGTPTMWEQRLRIFARTDSQIGGVIEPRRLSQFAAAPPLAVFMRTDLWATARRSFDRRYPEARVRDVTPDGRLVVVEVPRPVRLSPGAVQIR
jgi:4-amino-4-deoxy-L-arabinose transferase-like glycosyltransferase